MMIFLYLQNADDVCFYGSSYLNNINIKANHSCHTHLFHIESGHGFYSWTRTRMVCMRVTVMA